MSRVIATVALIPDHRMTGLGKMNTDLIPSSRFEPHAHVGRFPQPVLDSKVRYGRLAFLALFLLFFPDRVPLETLRRPQTSGEGPFLARERSCHNGRVFSLCFANSKLVSQLASDLRILSENQEPRRPSIESMNDRRPAAVSATIEILAHRVQ